MTKTITAGLAALALLWGCGSSDPTEPVVQRPIGPEDPTKPPPKDRPRDPPDPDPVDPWPTDDVRHFGPGEGLPGGVVGVGVDDGQNVYVIDGAAAYALPAGGSTFVRTATGGQFELGFPVASVAGGPPGQVYLGFLASEGKTIYDLTEEEKRQGDVDRMNLQPDGSLTLDYHFQIQNNNARWMDETRSILTMKRVVGGPYHGDVYLGSNHGATVLRGDAWADHRHPVFVDENDSLYIGYVHAVDVDSESNFIFGAYWMLAAVAPAPLDDLERWVSIVEMPWLAYSWPEHLGPIEEPKDIRSIAGHIPRSKIYVGMFGLGLAEMTLSPRNWRSIPGTPDTHILALEWEREEDTLWVGTMSSGLWAWDMVRETWTQSPHVPSGARVYQLLLDETFTPRTIYAATDHGLYVIRAPGPIRRPAP
jgi:hypothetical protein